MTQALYYQASYERLKARIDRIAPDLEVVLMDEAGGLSLNGQTVSLADIRPEYFWLHSELYGSRLLGQYFDIMRQSPSARWLHTINTGLDHLPYVDLLRKGMCITNNHSQAIAIAEYVIGQVLARFQDIASLHANQARRVWEYKRYRELHGSHVLIIGFGEIGQAIAKRLRSFGMEITAVRRERDGAGLADRVLNLESMGEALGTADVVVLAATSNAGTRDLVDAEFLGQMKSSATLVNIARGDLVVEEDLRQALDRDQIDYAILDVFRQEPLPADSWFWSHPRIAVTPHSSNAGAGMGQRSTELFLTNLEKMTSGETPLNVVSEKDIL